LSEARPSFIHRFVPGQGSAGNTTLLLLHGTGGDENDLLDLGGSLLPGATLLSPRGKVLENGGNGRAIWTHLGLLNSL